MLLSVRRLNARRLRRADTADGPVRYRMRPKHVVAVRHFAVGKFSPRDKSIHSSISQDRSVWYSIETDRKKISMISRLRRRDNSDARFITGEKRRQDQLPPEQSNLLSIQNVFNVPILLPQDVQYFHPELLAQCLPFVGGDKLTRSVIKLDTYYFELPRLSVLTQ
jgi:hypothetical protein